jgi:exopolyphosphatase/guanosine-5'-triphosphate,3'-diphosphate pyrophosphatase
MRLGVLDVGSNTIHLQVMDAHFGARPTPATNYKVDLRLTEYLDSNGSITEEGIALLDKAVSESVLHANQNKTDEILAFATSALREAKNGLKIISNINEKYGIDLQILEGADEASMTFLAVRRWLGWSAGKLLVLDIGGGSLEIATGSNENPDTALSLPLGASRLTREFLTGDPFNSKSIDQLTKYVTNTFKSKLPKTLKTHDANHSVATSKTFRTLARITSHWYGDDIKILERSSLNSAISRLVAMTHDLRTDLPGVSMSRSGQIVAGAIAANEVMGMLDLDQVEICPWALREGILLRRLDWLSS